MTQIETGEKIKHVTFAFLSSENVSTIMPNIIFSPIVETIMKNSIIGMLFKAKFVKRSPGLSRLL